MVNMSCGGGDENGGRVYISFRNKSGTKICLLHYEVRDKCYKINNNNLECSVLEMLTDNYPKRNDTLACSIY